MSVRGRLCDGGQLAALVVLFLVLLMGPLAAAQDALEQTAQAGAFVDEDAEDVDEEALAAAVDEVRADGVHLYVGVLADDPAEGVESAADVVLDHAGEGTVLLLSPGEVGASSDDYDTATIDAGLDAAAEDFAEDGDVPEGVRAFGGALATADSGGGGALGGLTGDDGDSRGILGGLGLPVILIGGLVVIVLLALLFGRGRRRRGHHGYGGYGRRRGYRRRRGGLGSFAAGAATATAAGRRRNNRSTQTQRQGRSTSRSSGRSTGRSRSRGSSSRSRSRGSRRR